jgi:glyoxylase-like metal-dependent hydrolase (beta-lactamase superfamily II)
MAKVIPLSEGSFTVDGTKEFIPFDPARDSLSARGRGSLLVEIQPFVVITGDDYLLLDTGLGFRGPAGTLALHQHLRDHGIEPEQINKVLLSHLHKDHAAAVTEKDPVSGIRQLSFPQATYYVNRNELEYALSLDGKSYHAEDFALLKDADQVEFTGSEGEIGNHVHYEVTGGHCRYHQVFWIRDEEGTYFFGGDVAPQLSQLKNRFIAKYDEDGRKSMELRQHYKEVGAREGWVFLFYHDIGTPSIQLPQAD